MRVSNRCRRDLWWALLFVLSCCGLLLHARPVLGEVAPTPDRSRILWTEKRNPPPLPESLPGVDVLWAKNMCRAQEEVFPGTGAKDEGKDYLFPLFKYEWLSARPGGDRESPDTLVAASGNILDVHDPDSCERLELCCYQMTVAECTKDSDCSSGLTCGLCPMGDPGCSAGQQVCLAPGGKVTGTDEQRKAKAECLGIVRQNVNLADGYRRCGPAKYGYYKSRLCNLGGDVPFSHPFGDDWSAQMINAPQYENLLAPNDSGCEACAPEGSPDYYDGCLTCPTGLLRSDTNPNGVMANSDAVEVRRRTGRSSMHIEYEKGMFPKDFYPKEGDDLAVFGRHIVDCGHDNYTAEIHPPLLLASASPSKTGGCASKLIARNFYNSQEFWNGRTTEGFLKNIIVELLQSLLLKRNLLTMEVGSDFAEPFTGDFVGPKALEYFLQPREGRHNPFDQLQVSVRAVERTGVSLRIADARPELDGKDAVKVTVELKGADYANGWRRSVAKDPDLVKTEPRILRGHDVAVISKDYAWLGNLEDWMWGVFGVSALVTVTGLCNNVITCAIATVMIMNVSRVIATGMLTSFYTNRDYDRPGGSWVATPRATRPLCTFSLPQLTLLCQIPDSLLSSVS